jgi:hypothetical protein
MNKYYPDAIMCNKRVYFLHDQFSENGEPRVLYESFYGTKRRVIRFKFNGDYLNVDADISSATLFGDCINSSL